MKYVQLSRNPGRVKIILSRVLAAGLAVAAVCLLVFFLRMEDFFFFGIVGVALIALLAAADVTGDSLYRTRAGRIIHRVLGWAGENNWRIT